MCEASRAGTEQDWGTKHKEGPTRVRLDRQRGLLGLGAVWEPLKGFYGELGRWGDTCGTQSVC